MSNGSPGVGFFGKLPSHGDFLGRRLPRGFTDPWDRWLQTVIANSREQLGSDWLDIYLTSPLWRFALAPGLCGDGAWCGLLMPSVDRVGRYFPLTLAVELQRDGNLLGLLASAEEWYQACEKLALGALEDGFDLEAFDQALQGMAAPPLAATATRRTEPRSQRSAWHFEFGSLKQPGRAFSGVGQALLERLFKGHALWWTQGSERVQPCLLITEGLPPVECFAALLDGQWAHWGWGDYRLPLAPADLTAQGQ